MSGPVSSASSNSASRNRFLLLLGGGVLLGAALVALLLVPDLKGGADDLIAWVRGTAMPWLDRLPTGGLLAAATVLPAVGCPVSPLYLLVGTRGPWVAGLGLAVTVALNLSFSYVLARSILRPLLSALIARRGLHLPEIQPHNRLRITALVRLTPGLPLFLQSTLLALAGIPFRPYLILSWVLQYPIALAMALLGDSFARGGYATAIAGVGLLIAALIAIRLLRDRLRSSGAGVGIPQ